MKLKKNEEIVQCVPITNWTLSNKSQIVLKNGRLQTQSGKIPVFQNMKDGDVVLCSRETFSMLLNDSFILNCWGV